MSTMSEERQDPPATSQSWTLTFTNTTKETKFWAFNVPQFPVANTVTAAAMGILIILVLATSSNYGTGNEDYSDPETLALYIPAYLIIVGGAAQCSVHISTRLGLIITRQGHHLSRVFMAFIITFVILAPALSMYVSEVNARCDDEVLYDDTSRKVYPEKNCVHFLQGYVAATFTLAVLLQLPFSLLLKSAVVTVTAVTITSAAYGSRVSASHAQLPNTIVSAAFALFIRYHRERQERSLFEVHLALEGDIFDLRERREELYSVCRTLLPSALMQRMENADRTDNSDRAAVLCISLHDFSHFCTSDTPMRVAKAIDTMRVRVWQLVEEHGLHSVSCIQDQLVAFGNLLKPMRVDVSVYQCCAAALKAVSLSFFIDEMVSPPLHAAVHVGPVVAGFIGHRWVRYDALGEGVDKCRSALLAAEANTVVATDAAVDECPNFLVARETGLIDNGQEVDSANSSATDSTMSHEIVNRLYVIESLAGNPESELLSLSVDSGKPSNTMGGSPVVPRSSGSGNYSGRSSDANPDDGFLALRKAQKHLANPANFIDGSDDALFRMETQWCMFDRFVDDDAEERFLDQKIISAAPNASRTLLAFGWMILFFFLILMLFFEGPRAPIAAIMLVLGAFAAAGLAVLPIRLSPNQLLKHHSKWSFAVMLLPLWVVFATAVARPSLVGNESRTLLMVGTFVRSTCFRQVKYQLLAKPIMLVVSHLHILIPGGRIRFPIILVYFLVLWSIRIDRDVDRAERGRFVIREKQKRVLSALKQEQRVREGVLRSTMPKSVFTAVQGGIMCARGATVNKLSDAALMLVSAAPQAGPQATASSAATVDALRAASAQLHDLERILDRYPQLCLISAFADVAMIVGPIAITGKQQRTTEHHLEAIRAAIELGENSSALLEFDETIQLTRTRGVPSFTVFGAGINRIMAVASAVDRSALSGAVVTDRVIRIAETVGITHAFNQSPLGRMKIRGVGVIRLTRLKATKTEVIPH